MDSLPVVPFGKYKDQPLTNMLADTSYMDWYMAQPNFKKSPFYNIVINQINQPSDTPTPEHNKIQNMFLDNDWVTKFMRKMTSEVREKPWKCRFETKHNWDVAIDSMKNYRQSHNCKNCLDYRRDGMCDHTLSFHTPYIFIEIKTLIGDDYPCILRKMNTQIEMTKKDKDRIYSTGYGNLYKEGHEKYCLLVKEFKSETTTKDQLIQIFNNSGINVIFLEDIDESPGTQLQTLKEKRELLRSQLSEIDQQINLLESTN